MLYFLYIIEMDSRCTSVPQFKENCGFRDFWNWTCHVCVYFYDIVVTDFKGDFGSVMKMICIANTFVQVPTETGTCWWGNLKRSSSPVSDISHLFLHSNTIHRSSSKMSAPTSSKKKKKNEIIFKHFHVTSKCVSFSFFFFVFNTI